MITGFQLRASKAVLGLTAKHISSVIGVHHGTVTRLCKINNLDYLSCSVKTMVLLKNFFETNGIILSTENAISLKIELMPEPLEPYFTCFQLKVARIATGLTQAELSSYVKISSSLISLLEHQKASDYIESSKINISSLKRFFEHLGIVFHDDLTVSLIKDPKILLKKN